MERVTLDNITVASGRHWLIPYVADESWVEPALFGGKETLEKSVCPPHNEQCEYGAYLDSAWRESTPGVPGR